MIRSMQEFTSAFQAARCVSTPLVAIRTADPASTTHFIIDTLKQSRELPPLLGWDLVHGLYVIGWDSGEELARVLGERQAATIGLVHALFLAQRLCEDGLLLYSNAHRFWGDPGVMQGSGPLDWPGGVPGGTGIVVSGELPNHEGWTGAEIKECCSKTHRLGITLVQASRYIVPVARSAAEQIKALRQMVSGKFISASMPGVYRYEEETAAPGRRVIRELSGPLTVMEPSKSEV